jgi:hypothetical protein
MLAMGRRRESVWISLLFIGLFFGGCNGGPDLEPVIRSEKVTLSGTFYTESPDELIFPVKVLFCPGLLGQYGAAGEGSDPLNQRIAAAREFIDRYNEYENVSFEVMLWNSSVFRRTMVDGEGGFTKDIEAIQSVFDTVVNTSLTDYLGTIQEISSDIQRDIYSVNDLDNVARSKYIVIFSAMD